MAPAVSSVPPRPACAGRSGVLALACAVVLLGSLTACSDSADAAGGAATSGAGEGGQGGGGVGGGAPHDAGPVIGDDGGVHRSDAGVVPDARVTLDTGVGNPGTLDCGDSELAFTRADVGEVELDVGCAGEGPALVLLHGFPELHLAWSKLVPGLVESGYRVVVPDQRGYNLSEKPPAVEDYGIDHLVADVDGLIDATGQAQVVLVAHDWGGVVAWAYAHRHPERLRGLVIMNGPHPDVWFHPEIDPVQSQASNGYVPLLAGPTGELSFGVIETQLAPHLSADELVAYRAAWQVPGAATAMLNWYRQNVYPTYRLEEGNTVTVPTLVLWGEEDAFATPSELEHIPDYVTDLQVHVYPGVDHWLPHQVTSDLLARLTTFEQALP